MQIWQQHSAIHHWGYDLYDTCSRKWTVKNGLGNKKRKIVIRKTVFENVTATPDDIIKNDPGPFNSILLFLFGEVKGFSRRPSETLYEKWKTLFAFKFRQRHCVLSPPSRAVSCKLRRWFQFDGEKRKSSIIYPGKSDWKLNFSSLHLPPLCRVNLFSS